MATWKLDLDLLVPGYWSGSGERSMGWSSNQDRNDARNFADSPLSGSTMQWTEDAPVNDHAQRIDAVNDEGQTLTAVIMPCKPAPPVDDEGLAFRG